MQIGAIARYHELSPKKNVNQNQKPQNDNDKQYIEDRISLANEHIVDLNNRTEVLAEQLVLLTKFVVDI